MNWNRVVDAGTNASLGQVLLQLVSLLRANHVEVIDSAGPGWLKWQNQARGYSAQRFVVTRRNLPTLLIPLREVTKFDLQDSGLNRIEPPVVTFHLMVILARLAVIAEHAYFLGQRFVVSRNRSGLSTGAQVLPRIEAKSCRMAHRTCFSPAIFLLREVLCAVCLAGILDNDQFVAVSKLENRIHVRSLTVDVHRDNSRDRCLACPVKCLAGFAVEVAFPLEIFLKLGRVHAIGPLIDVHKIRPCTRLADGFCGRNERVGHRDNNIARLDARCQQGKQNGVGPAGDSEAVRSIRKARKIALESLNHWAADEACGSQRVLKNGKQFLLDFFMKADQIQKRNLLIV